MVLLRLWCRKLKLSKPYLELSPQTLNRCFSSRNAWPPPPPIISLSSDGKPLREVYSAIMPKSIFDSHGGHSHFRRYRLRKIIALFQKDVSEGHNYPTTEHDRLSVSQEDALESFDMLCYDGNYKEAVEVLGYLVKNKGYVMDLKRVLGLVKLCSEPEALEEAKAVHEYIIALVSPSDVSSRHAVIEMYSSCGSVDDALYVFDEMLEKSLETWFLMMRCYLNNGYGEKAIELFTRFKEEGNKPDGDMFNYVFTACTLIENAREGLFQFEAMQIDYGIIPSMEHYCHITKLLGTSCLLDEALSFVERMPMEPSVEVWETLMNVSRVHGDMELGDRCAELVEKLDATRLDKVSSAGLVVTKEESKPKSRIKDTSHQDVDRMYDTLKMVHSEMLEMGYDRKTFMLSERHEAVENEKKERIFGYREEVAIVKKLLDSKPRCSIFVLTNMRICVDCHEALKLMSVITGRKLTKKDSKRYHEFKNGVCGCNGYW